MAVVVEVINRAGNVLSHQVFAHQEVRIGRSYKNDLVLHDPHVDAFHLRIDCLADEHEFNCADLDSINGITDADGSKIAGVKTIRSGDVLTLGKTLLRISSLGDEVAPTVPLSLWEGVADFLSHWWTVLLSALIVFALYAINAHIDNPMVQNTTSHFQEAFYLLVVAVVYGGFYAVIGKIFRHEGRFGLHVNLFFVVAIVALTYDFIQPVLFFNLGLDPRHFLLGALISAALCYLLIYASLRYATYLRASPRILVASLLPVVIVSFALFEADTFKGEDHFLFRPKYDSLIMPAQWQWQPAATQQQFLSGTEELYRESVN